MSAQVDEAAERAARSAYGRLLAYLAYRWGNIAAAEDALAEAFATALATWPKTGVPDSPDAWLMAVAKRELLQVARHQKLAADPEVTVLLAQVDEAAPDAPLIPDARLKLMFVCAHPAIDAAVRTPLMLQTVLGLDAKRIAAAFLVSPSAMAQRLVRAKTKIAQAGIRFEEPEARDLPDRTHAVLEAIYAAYGLAWDGQGAQGGQGGDGGDLTQEALYLAELAAALMPHSAEALGLWALLLLCESRRAARYRPLPGDPGAAATEFVPLHLQDVRLWNLAQVRQADQVLRSAAQLGSPGPYQLEAAIQAAHCHRAFSGCVPWDGIAALYDQLVQLAPTLGAQVSRAVAVGTARSPAQGLACLDALDQQAVRSYQPFWVARAHLLSLTHDVRAAVASYTTAIGLTTDEPVRRYLWARVHRLEA